MNSSHAVLIGRLAKWLAVLCLGLGLGAALLVPAHTAAADEGDARLPALAALTGFDFPNLADVGNGFTFPGMPAMSREAIEKYLTDAPETIEKLLTDYAERLGTAESLTPSDEAVIAAARELYDQLPDEQKERLGDAAARTLETAEARIAELRASESEPGGTGTNAATSDAAQGAASSGNAAGEPAAASKSENPMNVRVTAKTAKLGKAKASKKSRTVRPITVTGAAGKVTYAKVSRSAKLKKFKVAAKTGKITVPAKAKKKTYKVKVCVSAAGDDAHLPATKFVTCKIKVR